MSEGKEQSELSKNKFIAIGIMAAIAERAVLYNECAISLAKFPHQNRLHISFNWSLGTSYSVEIIYGDGRVIVKISMARERGGEIQIDISSPSVLHREFIENLIADEISRIDEEERRQKVPSE